MNDFSALLASIAPPQPGDRIQSDPAEIRRALSVLCEPGATYELRALDAQEGRWNFNPRGYFRDLDALAAHAVLCSNSVIRKTNREIKAGWQATGVYITLNPVLPELFARAANELEKRPERGSSTADHQIVDLHWLLIDFDPIRASGISSTEAELQNARTRAIEFDQWWDSCGLALPKLIAGMSGNGYHRLPRIKLANKTEHAGSGGLLHRILQGFQRKFSDNLVKVDEVNYNAARICKLYGTSSRKGSNIDERPWRQSRLEYVPDPVVVLELEQLHALEALLDKVAPKTVVSAGSGKGSSNGNAQSFGTTGAPRAPRFVPGFIAKHNLKVGEPTQYRGGWRWRLEVCPFNPEHGARGDVAIFENGAGMPGFRCQHDTCSGNHWKQFRKHFEPDYGSDGEKKESEPTQLDILLEIGEDGQLFHDGEDCYTTIEVGQHLETHLITSTTYKRHLIKCFLESQGTAPNGESLGAACNTLAALAQFNGEDRKVYLRVAGHNNKYYLDLCNPAWRVVEIDADWWHIIESKDCPVRFRRPSGMRELPMPVPGGSLSELRPFLNVPSEDDFGLLVTVLTDYFRDVYPYPVLVFTGGQGSGKSTNTFVLRQLLDPNAAALRSAPKEPRDLAITANNSWIIALNNLSSVPIWLSDDLCRLANKNGFSTRKLYTDAEETIFEAARPIIGNSIEHVVVRGDLLDRAIIEELPPISEQDRQTEEDFHANFEAVRPRLLGVLLDLVSAGLKNLPDVKLKKTPRMADYARWAAAVAKDMTWVTPGSKITIEWSQAAFEASYEANRNVGAGVALDASLVAGALQTHLPPALDDGPCKAFEGTATELLRDLNAQLTAAGDEKITKTKNWPQTPRALSQSLRRLAPTLLTAGIQVGFDSRDKRRRSILIVRLTVGSTAPLSTGDFASFASPVTSPQKQPTNAQLSFPKAVTQNDDAKFPPAKFASPNGVAHPPMPDASSGGDANVGAGDANENNLRHQNPQQNQGLVTQNAGDAKSRHLAEPPTDDDGRGMMDDSTIRYYRQ